VNQLMNAKDSSDLIAAARTLLNVIESGLRGLIAERAKAPNDIGQSALVAVYAEVEATNSLLFELEGLIPSAVEIDAEKMAAAMFCARRSAAKYLEGLSLYAARNRSRLSEAVAALNTFAETVDTKLSPAEVRQLLCEKLGLTGN
jgi:hypothetical protein